MNVDQVEPDFAVWFRGYYKSNSRPMAKSIIDTMAQLRIGSAPVHQFMKHIKFSGSYRVHYGELRYSISTVHKKYVYLNGEFVRYAIYDKSSRKVAEGVPKSMNEPEAPAPKEFVNNFPKRIALTGFIIGVKCGTLIEYDLDMKCFRSELNNSILVPVELAHNDFLFAEYKFIEDTKNFCLISGYHMLQMSNTYCLGYHNGRKHFGLYKPLTWQDKVHVTAREIPCTDFTDTGFYKTNMGIGLYISKDGNVIIESKGEFPIRGMNVNDLSATARYEFP